MQTLTLCRTPDNTWLLQATDETNRLDGIYYLDGESYGRNGTWEAVTVVGSQDDPNDTDGFWSAVDTACAYLARTAGIRKGWEAYLGAYRGVDTRLALRRDFRALLHDTVPCPERTRNHGL